MAIVEIAQMKREWFVAGWPPNGLRYLLAGRLR
jgi:hypothetical protein